MQIMGACKNYIFDTDISPSRLRNLLIRRHCRAVSRKYGLEAFYSILEIMSGEDFSFLTTLSSTCCVQALMWLRPGLRGVSKTTKNVVASANVRHHYLKGLEGCVSTIIDDVQASFLQLYVVWMGFVLVSLALLTYTNARTFSNTNQHSNTGTQK